MASSIILIYKFTVCTRARLFIALLSLTFLSIINLSGQPGWYGGTPTVTQHIFTLDFSYGLDAAGKVYVILMDGNNLPAVPPPPSSALVQGAALSGPISGIPFSRISTWVINVPDADKNKTFTVNALNQLGGLPGPPVNLIPNHDYTFYFVAANPSGTPLQEFPIRIYVKTLPCPDINILTGFSQTYTCYTTDPARIPTAKIAVVIDDPPPPSGILKGTRWVFIWGDGDTTIYISAADNDIPSSSLRSHPYPAKTSCNYSIELSVTNPCGKPMSIGYTAVVHGRDIPDDGDGILSIVNNATNSSVVQICEG
ncbi:MAG TPA: hypothetical protein VMV77_04455, partial [Bacteroidales bacterium]|nr:hypothetical protein [Bacteroidales bacterium]